jgi:FKBP-type peptidyl-prolyl cis-trans isomerase FkpA
MLKNLVLTFMLVVAFSGCGKDEGFKCEYDPCQYPAPASQIADIQNYLTANGLTATQHCSGIFYRVVTEGTGDTPTACNTVNVSYEGRLTDGTVFDSSNPTATFNLSTLIAGWANGLPLIKTGGRIILYIPPYLGYGNSAQGNIPANSILIFDISLHAVL